MTQHNAIKLFETKKVRTIWDDKEEKWYFSIVDVVAVLTDSPNPRKYWSVGKSSVSCPLKPSDSAPLKHSTMPP